MILSSVSKTAFCKLHTMKHLDSAKVNYTFKCVGVSELWMWQINKIVENEEKLW